MALIPSSGGDGAATPSTVRQAAERFTSTNGVCVSTGRYHQENADGTTHAIPSAADYNEFINNYSPHFLALSYEAAGGASVRVRVNGVDATYKDLLNAADVGANGQVNFGGGANGNFNRRARVEGEILKEEGDYIEIFAVDVAPFSQIIIAVLDNETDLAHTTTTYNFRTAAGGNGNVENYSFRDATNTVVASGSETNAVYRITRTLGGFSFARDGVELYCTEVSAFTPYPPGSPDIDTLADFSSGLKTGNSTLSDGRFYTTVEDTGTTTESIERVFNSLVTPFVEIEVVRDATATHGPMLRANATGGRQAQLRFNLSDGAYAIANSGANTSLPILHQAVVEEETIKYLIEFTDLVAHTELEISPAAHDAALSPLPAAAGSTSFVGVRLFESNPLSIGVVAAYADDAAAGAAGLTTGQRYQTDGSGAAPLDVAGIVMVKQ